MQPLEQTFMTLRALVLVDAVDVHLLGLGDQVDQLLRAGRDALAAGHALVGVDLGHTVDDMGSRQTHTP